MATPSFELPESFSGIVRLFPLPNMVLFPGVVQGLHLFEPRYRQLMDDTIIDDELITMALVTPESAGMEERDPDIFPTVCIGKIMTHAKLDDGRYNLLIAGMRRGRIVRELDVRTPYRQAEVELITDIHEPAPSDAVLKERLLDAFRKHNDLESSFDKESVKHLLSEDIELGQLTDLICFAAGGSPLEQQSVLSMADVLLRVQLVLKMLGGSDSESSSDSSGAVDDGGSPEFPPDFSLN